LTYGIHHSATPDTVVFGFRGTYTLIFFAPWRAPDQSGYSNALNPTERVPIDPARQYDLLELIDVAQRVNPETRVAWERARQAAIAIGLVESEYFPMSSRSSIHGWRIVRESKGHRRADGGCAEREDRQ